MASDENEYYDCSDDNECYQSASDDDAGGNCSDDNECYQSASDDDAGGNCSDDDGFIYEEEEEEQEEGEEDDLQEVDNKEKMYGVLNEDAVRVRQDECTARVADLISVPPAVAAVVLRHCKWSDTEVVERWFSDKEQQRIRDAVGLPAGGVPVARNDAPLTCAICFELFPPGEMLSAGCAHFYCFECCRGYVHAAVEEGPGRCLSLRCPDPACPVAVVRDLVDEVADDGDRTRYAEFAIRSYVGESNRKMTTLRWCPAPGCAFAVEFLGSGRCREGLDVVCDCKHTFCLNCGDEAHRPAACDTVRKWMAKHSSDAETANWVLAHTKACPECRRPIEKNKGCMHMTCTQCQHEFCWLCLGPWKDHGGSYYDCNRYSAARQKGKLTDEDIQRDQAKMSIDKYLHYYERWAAHERSRNKALEDLAGLQLGAEQLESLAAVFDVAPTKLAFLAEAYVQIADCRRQLRWTYAYGYYMPDDAPEVKRELFECLQSDAEASLERLHGCAERERRDLVCGADDPAEVLCMYEQKLTHLTRVTRNHFENLVTALENDLTEVKVTVEGVNVRRPVGVSLV